MFDKVSELYDDILETYFDEYNHFSVAKTKRFGHKLDPIFFFLKYYIYNLWYKEGDEKPRHQ